MTVYELVDQLIGSIEFVKQEWSSLYDDLNDVEMEGDLADADDIEWIRQKIAEDKEIIKERETALKVINQIRGVSIDN